MILWKDTCYKFIRQDRPLRWTAAEENCINDYSGHLVSIRDVEDMNFVHSLILENGSSRSSNIYIGKYTSCILHFKVVILSN